jgi:hypothetical protein
MRESFLASFVLRQISCQLVEQPLGRLARTALDRARDAHETLAQPLVLVAEPLEVALERGPKPAQRREVEAILEREVRLERVREPREGAPCSRDLTAVERLGDAPVELVELAMLRRDHASLALHAELEARLADAFVHVYSTTPSMPAAPAITRKRVRQAMQ